MKSGRLKGQAFLKFKSIEMAQKALLKTNGYILHDKPMIVVSILKFQYILNKINELTNIILINKAFGREK